MKKLGNTVLTVSDLIVGGNVFGWTVDETRSFELLDEWLHHGINTIDSADNYAHWGEGLKGGESETVLGKWMKSRNCRQKIVIATKFGGTYSENSSKNISAAYARQAIERSLKRLQTDYIDLYQVHHDDGKTTVEETIDILNEFVREGKVRAIGVSNMSKERIVASVEYSMDNQLMSYGSIQPEYNMVFREKFEQEYAPLAKQYNLGVMPYFSLASGFLSGKYKKDQIDLINTSARQNFVKKYVNERNWAILDRLELISEEISRPMAAVAIRWVMQQKYITAPIVSATSIKQLRELVSSTEFQLSKAQINDLK